MTSNSPPRAPKGLGPAGRRLWRDVHRPDADGSHLELRPDELTVLAAAARTADELVALEAALADAPTVTAGSKGQDRVHPLYGEVRAHRALLSTLLARLDIPEDADDDGLRRARSWHARNAARARWSRGA